MYTHFFFSFLFSDCEYRALAILKLVSHFAVTACLAVFFLESGSSRTSPVPYSGERESFSLEEKHLEKVLSLQQAELAETKSQLQSAQDEIVSLREELSVQQERLLEAKKVIEFESARAKTLSADSESLQQRVQVLCSQVQELQGEVRKGRERLGELWQTNCQQLTVHDDLMFEKEEEIRLLRMRLHEVEMELTKLKVE